MSKILYPFILLLFIGLCSCDKGERILKKDVKKIEEYLSDNNIDAERTSDDLFYSIEEEGNGEFPTETTIVTVDYKGYLIDGSVFDATTDDPIEFSLQNVIRGWRLGIPLFSKGGKGKLFVPSHLAYGESERPGIPSNSVLIFDIHLVDF